MSCISAKGSWFLSIFVRAEGLPLSTSSRVTCGDIPEIVVAENRACSISGNLQQPTRSPASVSSWERAANRHLADRWALSIRLHLRGLGLEEGD
jgi:hypothetical protein